MPLMVGVCAAKLPLRDDAREAARDDAVLRLALRMEGRDGVGRREDWARGLEADLDAEDTAEPERRADSERRVEGVSLAAKEENFAAACFSF